MGYAPLTPNEQDLGPVVLACTIQRINSDLVSESVSSSATVFLGTEMSLCWSAAASFKRRCTLSRS